MCLQLNATVKRYRTDNFLHKEFRSVTKHLVLSKRLTQIEPIVVFYGHCISNVNKITM